MVGTSGRASATRQYISAGVYQPHAKDVARFDYWREVFGPDSLDSITSARITKARAKVRSLKDDRIFPPKPYAKKAKCLDLTGPWNAARKVAGLTDFHWHESYA